MIFDTFTFFNECDLLKIRLEILKPLGMTHILVESPQTHQGDPKPLYFKENKHLFSEYNIVHYVSPEREYKDTWFLEGEQRNDIQRALEIMDYKDDDLILVSDLDEVPTISAIYDFKEHMGVAGLVQNKYSYFLNCLEGKDSWTRARICTGKHLKTTTPNKLRNDGVPFMIQKGGHHWSFLGGVEKVLEKFWAYAHIESLNEKTTDPEVIKYKLSTLQSLWAEDYWQEVPLSTLPKYIQHHKEELKHLIYEKPSS